MRALVVSLVALAACTEKNPRFCSQDSDCADPALPFCDVNGEFPESGGAHNLCTPTPADCPVDRCGCTPGEALACDLDQLTVCAADGRSTTTATCALGCSTEDRCLTFEPSNGLGPALEMAGDEPDVVLPAGASCDTETGEVRDRDGTTIVVKSIMIDQPGAPGIRAFIGGSFEIGDVAVVGAPAVAFVSSGQIKLTGMFDVSARGRLGGPGALDSAVACVGASTQEKSSGGIGFVDGAGGGGASTPGARGGSWNTAAPEGSPGQSQSGFVPLVGGCRGGSVKTIASGTLLGGGGGGAVQIVSAQGIALTQLGVIDVGGGGGESDAGGGSGGLALLEAPVVEVLGATAGIAANGGAGGACVMNGAEATPNTTPARGPVCGSNNNVFGGDGATGAQTPRQGSDCTGTCFISGGRGGGGGAAGRAHFVTKTGELHMMGGPLLSVSVSEATLVPR